MNYPYLRLIIGSGIFIILLYLRVCIISSKGANIAGTEQNVIYSIQVFMDKGLLYFSPLKAPFPVTQYTPLYYYLCCFTAKTLNLHASDIQSLYITGRLWNVVFNLVTALMLYQTGRHIFKLTYGQALFLFLASFALTFAHNFAVRSDSMQDMFAISAIYCFLYYYRADKAAARPVMALACGILLSALSAFAKQSGIQYILIFSGYCLLIQDWKTFFKTAALSIIIYGGLLAYFIIKNPYFVQNVIGGVANGINLHDFFTYIIGRRIFIISVWPLILITAWLLIKNNSIFKGEYTERLLSAFFVGTLVFSMVTALKMGSTVQYFVLFINLSVLYTVKMLTVKKVPAKSNAGYLFAGFEVYIVLMMLVYIAYDFKLIGTFKDPRLEAQRVSAAKTANYIQQQMADYPGKYIFANITNDYNIPSRQSINNILYSQCLVPQMDIQEYSTGPLKVFGYSNLDIMIKTGQVEYIIESVPLLKFTILNDLAKQLKANYTLVKNIDGYLVYRLNLPGAQ